MKTVEFKIAGVWNDCWYGLNRTSGSTYCRIPAGEEGVPTKEKALQAFADAGCYAVLIGRRVYRELDSTEPCVLAMDLFHTVEQASACAKRLRANASEEVSVVAIDDDFVKKCLDGTYQAG